MAILAFVQAHAAVILAALLSVSEAMAFVFPNASGILKAISLLKKLGVKDVDGQ